MMADINGFMRLSAVFCSSYLLSFMLWGVAYADSGNVDELQNTLNQAAVVINKSLPKITWPGVVLDRVKSPGNKTLIYEYSLIYLLASQIDRKVAEQKIYRGSVDSLCNDQGQKDWFDRGVTTIYAYRDKKGSEVVRVTISQGDCDKHYRW